MILVLGGYFQGKKEYVKKRFNLSDSQFSDDIYSEADVVTNFENCSCELTDKEIEILLSKKAVISLESGCRVLAMDEKERKRVEKVNSVLQILSEKADSVVRVYCGIPVALRGKI